MNKTAFQKRIKKLSDEELRREESAAHQNAYYETFGNDHEAHSDAIQEYRMLARELASRRSLK